MEIFQLTTTIDASGHIAAMALQATANLVRADREFARVSTLAVIGW
jgi:predicted nucleic acid-binding protein